MARFVFCMALALFVACNDDSSAEQRLEGEIAELSGLVESLTRLVEGARDAQATNEAALTRYESLLDDARTALEAAQAGLTTRTGDLHALAIELAAFRGQLGSLMTSLEGMAGTLVLELPFVFGGDPLELDTPYPLEGTSDEVRFAQVRYWLSNVSLERIDGEIVEIPHSYYLVELRGAQVVENMADAPSTLQAARRESIVIANVPAGAYRSIAFHLGVDAEHNDDLSLPGGELHVLQNMTFHSWMWFTSYIFTKTSGTVEGPEGSASFLWDNGTNADYRRVTLPSFDAPISLSVLSGHRIRAEVDLESLVSMLDPRDHPAIGASSAEERALLADAFRDMISLLAVEPLD